MLGKQWLRIELEKENIFSLVKIRGNTTIMQAQGEMERVQLVGRSFKEKKYQMTLTQKCSVSHAVTQRLWADRSSIETSACRVSF